MALETATDVALEDRQLDSGKVLTILARSGFGEIADSLLRADGLNYSFNRSDILDVARVRHDLDEAIAVMVAQPAVEAALLEATAALGRDGSEEAFARQTALREKRQELDTRLANLAVAAKEKLNDEGGV